MIYPLALNSIRTGFFLKACCEFVFVFSLDGSCTFIAGHAPKCLSASFRHKIPKSSYLLFFILLAFSRALPYAGICLFYNLKANIGRVVLIWDHPFSSVFSMHSFLTPHAQAKLSTSLSLSVIPPPAEPLWSAQPGLQAELITLQRCQPCSFRPPPLLANLAGLPSSVTVLTGSGKLTCWALGQ